MKKTNWHQVEGHWKQVRGRALQKWGKLMGDKFDVASGKYEQLVGQLQEKYGNELERVRGRPEKPARAGRTANRSRLKSRKIADTKRTRRK